MSGLLTELPSEIIRQLLIDLSLGEDSQTLDWSIFATKVVDTPDKIISVIDTTPVLLGSIMTSGETQQYRGIQILVRGPEPTSTWTKSNDIAETLDKNVRNTIITISSTSYNIHSTDRVSGPLHTGKDVPMGKRDIFSLNFTASIRQIP